MSRKHKKLYKKSISYEKLGILPASFNRRRKLNARSPSRGDWVLRSKSMGRFVGVDPTGKVWIALLEYRVQFPFKTQCRIFDLTFLENDESKVL